MSGAASAIRYMWVRSTYNRLRTQAKRIRNPRYAVAMLVGLLYFYWILIHNPRATSEAGVNPFVDAMRLNVAVPLGATLLLVMASRWWLFKGDRSALAFTPAEVQFLFPAPISRRGLVHAKLLRGQVAILLNIVIWSVLLRGNAASAAGWQRGLALWFLFSTVALHRLGAALVRTNALEHERAGQKRSAIPMLVFAAVLAGVAWGIFSRWTVIQLASEEGIKATTDAIVAALAQPIPTIALWPVRALLQPVFALTGEQWLHFLPYSALVFALHYVWVLRLDASFEEAAIEATQVRAEAVRNVRSASGVRKRTTSGKIARVPLLSLTGRPEVAITWKNITAALRGTAWRAQTIAFVVILTTVAAVVSRSEKSADVFLIMCAAWGAMLLLIGPLGMRYDFRHDLPRLAMLRTYPLSGGKIVVAEIAAVTVLHTISIWTLMIVPVTMFALNPTRFSEPTEVPVILLAIALTIPAFNALMFTVHNAAALMFPSWVRLGTEPRGFETMGQNLLTMVATTLVAAVALVFPAGLAFLIFWLANSSLGVWAILAGALSGSVLLCLELWPVIFWLGSVFDRIDVAEIAPAP